MPEDENTETLMDSTPLNGAVTINRLMKMKRGQKQLVSSFYQAFGVPKPVAELCAQMVTFTP